MKTTCLPVSRNWPSRFEDFRTISDERRPPAHPADKIFASVARQHAKVKSFCWPYDNSPAGSFAALSSPTNSATAMLPRDCAILPRPHRNEITRATTARPSDSVAPPTHFRGRKPGYQTKVLKCPRDAEPRNLVRRKTCQFTFAERKPAGCRREKSSQDVQQRGFARAVWTDDGNDAIRLETHADFRQRTRSVKRLVQPFTTQLAIACHVIQLPSPPRPGRGLG